MASSSGASSSGQPAVVVDPAVTELLNAHASAASEEAFFQYGAAELAHNLLGQFLFFHDTKIAVRILETEAYPEGDAVFTKKFRKTCEADLKLKGGTLLAWSPCDGVGEGADFKYLFISAGPQVHGDLVLIRSCEPILGLDEIKKNRKNPTCKKTLKNLLIGPTKVSEGVGAESWPDNPCLYRNDGVQLFYGARKEGELVKRGKRILGGFGDTSYKGCEGKDSLYRFALETQANYKYLKKGVLVY